LPDFADLAHMTFFHPELKILLEKGHIDIQSSMMIVLLISGSVSNVVEKMKCMYEVRR
jgi:hypothetical protein